MNYEGKIYGKVAGRYIPLDKTTEDYDGLEQIYKDALQYIGGLQDELKDAHREIKNLQFALKDISGIR